MGKCIILAILALCFATTAIAADPVPVAQEPLAALVAQEPLAALVAQEPLAAVVVKEPLAAVVADPSPVVVPQKPPCPDWWTFCYWSQGEEWRGRNSALRTFAAIVAGIATALIAFWRGRSAHTEARTKAKGLDIDRHSKAGEQLGSPTLAVRLSGIYALESIAREGTPSDLKQVLKVLCAFVRHPTADPDVYPKTDPADAEPKQPIRTDVDAVMSVLTGRKTLFRRAGFRRRVALLLKLNKVGLLSALFGGIKNKEEFWQQPDVRLDLGGANLNVANLFGADLSGADLSGVDLFGADLNLADLSWANLSWANLTGADLFGAYLSKADLSGADLSGAKNLIQSQFDDIIWRSTPPNLPPGLIFKA